MKGKIKQIGIIIGKYLLLITFWILSIVLADSLTPILNEQGKPISTFFFEFIPFLGLVVGHFVMTKVFEKSTFDFVRVNKDNLLKNVAYGILFGLLWLTVSVIIICLLGNGKLINSFTLTAGQLLLFFFVLFINASMQELLVHGYLFSLLESKYSKLTALIATSFLFLLLHPGAINSGLTASINVFGAGLIFGLITIKFDSLICATFAHTVWNYFGAVWFGLIPLDNYPSMKLISVTGNSLLIGDKNGMETGFIVTVTMLTFVMYLWTRKQQVTRYWQKQG
ncbi:MAG: CPBP family intramembrane metalloprotease [Flavobacteriales bacterium]|nr:CPBP family intramembrane metalloprotease [Flavobacteriales bacterium]